MLPEDVGVPIPQLPALLAAVEAIARRHDVEIPVVAHAGDGNTHPAIIYAPGDADAERRARLAFDEIMATAIELGGTITGEHGVGRLKVGSLEAQLGPDVMALTRRVKRPSTRTASSTRAPDSDPPGHGQGCPGASP